MNSQPAPPERRDIGDILALGFGTATAMWAVGYFAHLPGSELPSALVFVVFVIVLFLGGLFAGRLTTRGIWGGVYTGVVAALVNLLILGSVLRDVAGAENVMRMAPLWALGSIVFCALIGLLGALVGARNARPLPVEQWKYRFSAVAMLVTLLLLVAGGLVTSHRAGMAVPDWPSTYGSNMFLYPLSKMTGSIYLEHSHRLLGTLVGLIAVVLAIYLQAVERRGWVKLLGWATLLLVIVQGIFGGMRVTENIIVLAIVHGVLAQAVLALFGALATVTSPLWDSPRGRAPHARGDKRLMVWLVVVVVLQVFLGSLLRHIDFSWHAHATVAVVVVVLAMIASIRISTGYSEVPVLRKSAKSILHAVGTQFILGFITLMPHLAVAREGMLVSPLPGSQPHDLPLAYIILATLHQIVGALIFTLVVRVMLLTWHLAEQGEE